MTAEVFSLQVADFLAKRRDNMFLEFDISISHSVRDTFLSTGNEAAYKVRTQNRTETKISKAGHLMLFTQCSILNRDSRLQRTRIAAHLLGIELRE